MERTRTKKRFRLKCEKHCPEAQRSRFFAFASYGLGKAVMCSAQAGTWRRARTCLNPKVIWRLQMQHQSRSFRSKARARIFNKKEQHQQESVSKRSKSSDLRGRVHWFSRTDHSSVLPRAG